MNGTDLKELRKGKGLSQKKLSEYTGISASTISRMENGKQKIDSEKKRILRNFLGELPVTAKDPCKRAAEERKPDNIVSKFLVYTDGGCAFNPGGPGGIGAVVIDQLTGEFTEISKGYHATTNNRMEIRAAIEALRKVPKGAEVNLYSDSKYLVNTMQGFWSRGKNLDLWNKIDRVAAGKKINYSWVRGHNGDPYNEKCDELATMGINSLEKEVDQGYTWNQGAFQKKGAEKKQIKGQQGGAMGIKIDLPEYNLALGREQVNNACQNGIRRFEGSRKTFRDYKDLKTGGLDGWSKRSPVSLREKAGTEVCRQLRIYLDGKQLITCLRWHGRGLSLVDSVRKVLVDQEISDNCTYR